MGCLYRQPFLLNEVKNGRVGRNWILGGGIGFRGVRCKVSGVKGKGAGVRGRDYSFERQKNTD